MVKTGGAWAGTFVTLDATGALATPSTGPAGVLYVDGTANAAEVTISGSNPYKWSVTLPALTAGQRVDMYITATIATIATAGFVASDQADTVLVSEVKAETALILADTGTDGVKIAADAITASVFDESTAFPIKSADTGATQIARVGADSDTLESLSDQMDAIKTETASILEDTGTTIPATLTTIDNFLDTEIASILEDTGTTLPATLASILEDTGTTLPTAISAIGGGAGGTEKTYTVTDADTGLPIADVHVWVSTDTAGANVVASGHTDVSGQVTFMLDAATYYIWRMKAGYNFTNPDTEVVV